MHHGVMNAIINETRSYEMDIFPENYEALPEAQQLEVLAKVEGEIPPDMLQDETARSTLASIYAMKTIHLDQGNTGRRS